MFCELKRKGCGAQKSGEDEDGFSRQPPREKGGGVGECLQRSYCCRRKRGSRGVGEPRWFETAWMRARGRTLLLRLRIISITRTSGAGGDKPWFGTSPNTSSPGSKFVTSGPTWTTVPLTSQPRVNGRVSDSTIRVTPLAFFTSIGFMLVAWTRMRSSVGEKIVNVGNVKSL